jgi:PmbA protein
MNESALLDAAGRVVELARSLGAEEVTARVGWGTSTELSRRDGKVEKAQESRSLGASISLLVDGRFSTHGTSDLRPEALRPFLHRAVEATRYLEPDPNRRLPSRDIMGEADAALDTVDPGWASVGPEARRAAVEGLEASCREALGALSVRSLTSYGWDGSSVGATVTSHGFQSADSSTTFGLAAVVSLEDTDGRLPEAWASASARHAADLPESAAIAAELAQSGARRLGSRAAPSGRYSIVLDRRVAGQLLGVLTGPLAGTPIYEKRSCLADKLGQKIASPAFTLWDDPLIPRAPGSQTSDGDGLPARRRMVVEDGVLRTFFLSVYNGRRLGVAPTTAGASNLVMAPGLRSPASLLADLGRAIHIDGFLGGNTNAVTGDFSFGIQGTLFEDGAPVHAVSEMNISGNLFELLERYVEAADDPYLYGSWRVPSLVFDGLQFSGR